jgi:hypothetical protein
MAIDVYKDLKTSSSTPYSNIKYTFANESKDFQEWFKKNYPGQNYDSFYSEEKGRIRNLFATVKKQAANQILKAKKFAPIIKDLDEFTELGFYPRDYFSKGKAGLTVSRMYQLFGDRLENLEQIDSKYFKAAKKYAAAPLEKKQEYGFKTKLIKDSGLEKNKSTFNTFKAALKRIGIFENEIIPEGQNLVGNRRARDVKITNQNIEAALGGQDLSAGIKVPGKKGSYIHLMHLADRSGPTLINELAYGPGELNTLLANKNSGAEKFRTSLSTHMDKISKNYKGKELYKINEAKGSIDQQRFKEALELKFGKSKGRVPLKIYIDTILNEEARLMGMATDGLITMRPLDPVTLKRMDPAFNVRGMGMDTNTTILDVAAEKKSAGKGKFGTKTADLNLTANLAFNEVKNNLTPKQIQPVIDNIAAAMKGGLQNQTYEDIMALASQCSKLKTSGKYKFGGRVKLQAGGNACSNVVNAVKQLPENDFINLSKNTAIESKAFKLLRGAGKYGAIAAGGAVAAGFVKKFMNDDPTTYLSNEEQQKNLLMDMVTGSLDDTPQESPAIGDAYLPALGTVAVAGTAATAPSTIDAVRGGALGAKKSGITKTALKTLGKGLSATASPLGLLATEPLYLAEQVQQGDSLGEIATNPFNYAGLAFTGPATEFATKGGLNPTIAKTMRLGISPTTLKTVSRRFGLPGLALSLGISGYETYDDYRNKRGMFSEE